VAEGLADREISIGDYVLSGGELGHSGDRRYSARLVPGALGNEALRGRKVLALPGKPG